jgi:hypothetical protein
MHGSRAADDLIEYGDRSGTKRTTSDVRNPVAIGGKPDMARTAQFGGAPSRTWTYQHLMAVGLFLTYRPGRACYSSWMVQGKFSETNLNRENEVAAIAHKVDR